MKSDISISVVSPVYRAEPIIDKLVKRIATELELLTNNFEIILVEDRGPDNSWEKIVENCEKYSFVKGVRLSRNCGQQHAMQCGLDASSGQYVVTMDCDLQDNPSEIKKLLDKASEGYDIVVAQRKDRQDSFVKKAMSRIFYSVLGYLTETEQDSSIANFVLMKRNVVDALKTMQDSHRYYPMMLQWVGFDKTTVEIKHSAREDGKSSYSFRKRLTLAFDTIINFSDKPLRLAVKFGVFLSLFSVFSAIAIVVAHLNEMIPVAGWTSLAVLNAFFSGAIISVLGVVGLYVGKTFESVKGRPSYLVDERKNFD